MAFFPTLVVGDALHQQLLSRNRVVVFGILLSVELAICGTKASH